MKREHSYRINALLWLIAWWPLVLGSAMAQVQQPPVTQVWPADTVPVVLHDSISVVWDEAVGGTRVLGPRCVVTLRNDPYDQDHTLIPMDVHARLKVRGYTNSDYSDYVNSNDADSLFFIDLHAGLRGAQLHVAGLDSALAANGSAVLLRGMHGMVAELDLVEVDTGTGWVSAAALPKGLQFDLDIMWGEVMVQDLNEPPSGLSTVMYNCAGTGGDAQEVLFIWDVYPGASAYDLEWTWVDDYAATGAGEPSGTPRSASQIPYDLQHDATRVSVPANRTSHRMPLLYDRGWIIWRIRALVPAESEPSKLVATVWSGIDQRGMVTDAQSFNSACCAKPVPGHQRGKNWQATSTFAEDAKHKEVVIYADGTSRPRQMVTRSNTLGTPIIGETVYDAIGRAAVDVMPVPYLKGCSTLIGGVEAWAPIEYIPDFNLEDSGSEPDAFTWEDLLGIGCGPVGPDMDNGSGAEYYYSEAYAEELDPVLVDVPEFLPRSEGRPYSQKQYTRDNTGRLRAQGGVGPAFQPGTGHETKQYYGKPEQVQLDRLFGSEAGYANHYTKNVSVDPNDQVSVSYVDMAGRTVATALACGTPPALDAIGDASVMLSTDLFNGLPSTNPSTQTHIDGSSLVFTTTLAVPCTGDYEFDYTLLADAFGDECWEMCAHCVYDLEITLVNNTCFNEEFHHTAIAGSLDDSGPLIFLTGCSDPDQATSNHFNSTSDLVDPPVILSLQSGEYTLTKRLSIHAPARDFYVSQLLLPENNNCVLTLDTFTTRLTAEIPADGCDVTCAECYEYIGTMEGFIADGGTAAQYELLRAECDATCKVPGWCTVALDNMMNDVTILNQYGAAALIVDGDGEVWTVTDRTSVFYSGPFPNLLRKPFESNPSGEAWRNVNPLSDPRPHLWQQPMLETMDGDWDEAYRDLDGIRTPIAITLIDEDLNIYDPPVVDEYMVFPEGGTFFTWPENLAEVSDFLANWVSGWERSLVRFHPEYCYYRDCKGYDDIVEGEDAPYGSSDGFDNRMLIAHSFDMAVSDGLLVTVVPGVYEFMFETEDAFITSGSYGQYADDLIDKVANYISINGVSYGMMEFAAAQARCGGDPVGCTGFGSTLVTEVNDAEWSVLRGFYLSEKYRIQKRKADAYVDNCDCPSLNVCIGEESTQTWWSRMSSPFTASFNYWQYGVFSDWNAYWNDYLNHWNSQPIHMACQACGQHSYYWFDDKVRRVVEPDQMPGAGMGAMDAAYQQFLQTGQCPVATGWQTFLHSLAAADQFDPAVTTPLTENTGWQTIFLALNDYQAGSIAPDAVATYDINVAGDELTIKIHYADGITPDCVVILTAPVPIDWTKIAYVAQLQDEGSGDIRLLVYMEELVEVDGEETVLLEIFGSGVCHDLAPCNFPPQCEPNDLALQFQNLMNALAPQGLLDDGSVNLEVTTPPGVTTTPVIQDELGPSITTLFGTSMSLEWSFATSPPRLYLTDVSASPLVRYRLDDLATQPAVLPVASYLSQTVHLQNITSANANNFEVDLIGGLGEVLCRLTGKAWAEVDGVSTPLPMGVCELAAPLACQTPEYSVLADLYTVVAQLVLEHDGDLDNVGLWSSPAMTASLANAICPACDEAWMVGGHPGLVMEEDEGSINVGSCVRIELIPMAIPFVYNNVGEATVDLGTQDEDGNYHAFEATLKNGGTITGRLRVEVPCLDLVPCEPCPYESEGPLALTQFSDSALFAMGLLYRDSLWEGYVAYTQAVDSTNERLGLEPSDSSFIAAIGYPDYRKGGFEHTMATYMRYLRNFQPEVDATGALQPAAFAVEYGNAVNVKEEYARYLRSVTDYNMRATSAEKPTMEAISDSAFAELMVADKIASYIVVLLEIPVSDSPPLGVEAFMMALGDTVPEDDCTELYRTQYLAAYRWLEDHNNDSTARCPNYAKYTPLYSLDEFRAANLCCSDTGLAVLAAYLELFYTDSLKCPGELPLLKTCPEPLEFAMREDERECQRLYALWVHQMEEYHESAYHDATHHEVSYTDVTFRSFQSNGYCDCVVEYMEYIDTYLAWTASTGELPAPVSLKDFCDDPCKYNHQLWLSMMKLYKESEYCTTLSLLLPYTHLAEYADMVKSGLCRCLADYMAYLQPYLTWTYPQPVPAQPQTLAQFCGDKPADCCLLLYMLKDSVDAYHGSKYEDTFGHPLPFDLKGCEDLINSGLCPCVPAYLVYLSEYLQWGRFEPITAPPPPPVSLQVFCNPGGPHPFDCAESWAQYEAGMIELTPLLNTVNSAIGSGHHFDLATSTLFTSADLCYCVQGYLADVELVLTQVLAAGNDNDHRITGPILSIIRYCHRPEPCDPPPLHPPLPEVPFPGPEPCPCCLNIATSIDLGSFVLHAQYIDSLRSDITARYDSTCMQALETLSMRFSDTEHHYTLYYYDQAGSLVRTVPPSGVKPLEIGVLLDEETGEVSGQAMIDAIVADRQNGTRTVFTDHKLASDHVYNSLGQPVRSAMPDQDNMDHTEFALTTGLPDHVQETGSWFLPSGRGYLTGYRTQASRERGLLYSTDDGGRTWQRIHGLLAADLNGAHFNSSASGFAVGEHGTLIETVDGGLNWDLRVDALLTERIDWRDVVSLDTDELVTVGTLAGSGRWGFMNGGAPGTVDLTGARELNGVGRDISTFVACGVDGTGDQGIWYTAVDPDDTPTLISEGGTTASLTTASSAVGARFVAGEKGVLLRTTDNDHWTTLRTGTTDDFIELRMIDDGYGIAIMDNNGVGELRHTADGGHTWQAEGTPGMDLTDLIAYSSATLPQPHVVYVAVGRQGRVVRVSASAEHAGVIPVAGAVPTSEDLTGVWASMSGDALCVVAAKAGGGFLVTRNLLAETVFWEQTAAIFPVGDHAVDLVGTVVAGSEIRLAVRSEDGRMAFARWDISTDPLTHVPPTPISGTDHMTLGVGTFAETALYYSSTSQSISTADLIGTWPPTPATPSASGALPTGTMQAGLPLVLSNTVLCAGQAGSLYRAQVTTGACVWTDNTAHVAPLPLYAMHKGGKIAAGAQGTVYVNQAGTWRAMPTRTVQDLRAVAVTGADIIVAVGDAGAATRVDISDPTFDEPFSVPQATDLSAVALDGLKVTVAGENGTFWYAPNVDETQPEFTMQTGNYATINALAHKPSSQTIFAFGDNALVHGLSLTTRMPVNNVYPPRLNGVFFSDGATGHVVGNGLTLRHTTDGGQHWNVVPVTSPGALDDYHAVHGNGTGEPLAVGDRGQVLSLSGVGYTAGTTSTAETLLGVAVAASGAAVVVGHNTTQGIYRTRAPGGAWVAGSIVPSPPASVNAVWSFPPYLIDGSSGVSEDFLIGGDASYLTMLRYEGSFSTAWPLNTSVLGDVTCFWFHDRIAGFVGTLDDGLYRTDASNSPLEHDTEFPWSLVDGLDDIPPQTTLSDIHLRTIGFSSRHQGFVGGDYTTAPVNFARTITDEGGLYSQRFWYDALGRIVLSQNTKQFNADPKRYSYSLYDDLGRVREAGELEEGTLSSEQFRSVPGMIVEGQFKPDVLDPAVLQAWVLLRIRREVTHTYYDEPLAALSLPSYFPQQHLRLRVATTTYSELEDGDELTYDHATHYSYDIHGNVKELLQDHPQLAADGDLSCTQCTWHRYKRMAYDHDLISGNVKTVYYQPGYKDQFQHRYQYDADNRITKVETSADDLLWSTDAEYFYYPHGPLARVELGQHKVQGLDYAYTLQGWLKGINSDLLLPTNDMGLDGWDDVGNENRLIGRDAFGFSLGYHGSDYEAIDAGRWDNTAGARPFAPKGGDMETEWNALYNGNIAHTTNSLQPFGGWSGSGQKGQALAMVYKYDQLNRLKAARGYVGLDADNDWAEAGATVPNMYKSTYSYDANGNITTAGRWDQDGEPYDELNYFYQTNNSVDYEQSPHQDGRLLRNRLYLVQDLADAGNLLVNEEGGAMDLPYGDDAFNDGNDEHNALNNYRYDELGNLVFDGQEDIADIDWTVAGKVRSVVRPLGSPKKPLSFLYGAGGQRIMKQVGNPDLGDGSREHYVRDAQGNIMAIYRYVNSSLDGVSMRLNDRPVYGSSRLGSYTKEQDVMGPWPLPNAYTNPLEEAAQRYELNDHLGNVNTVVSGRLLDGAGAGSQKQAEVITAQGYEPFGSLLPGRNFSSNSYKWGFNGQEKDDEMHGATGTSYAYEARMYDPRIGRWLSIDPNAKKYPGINPYNFSYNNPVIFNDPDGRDGRLTIQRNANGGGTITLESTVFLYGPDASAEMAKQAQDDFDHMSTGYEYKGADGQTWCVQINVTYVYQQSLSSMAEAMGQPRDESLSRYDLTGEQMESIGYQEGDNFMLLDRSLDQKVNGHPVGDISDHGGSSSTVSWVGARVINHSAMHEAGFDDYYPSAYFQGDLMGRLGTKIGDIHFINIAERALSEEPTPMGQFELRTKGFMSVKSDPFDRNQPSMRDKENHAKQKVAEQAERKAP